MVLPKNMFLGIQELVAYGNLTNFFLSTRCSLFCESQPKVVLSPKPDINILQIIFQHFLLDYC